MRPATRKQISNLKVRKDPKKLARSTKIHDDKHEYDRYEPVLCDMCGNEALACTCNQEGGSPQ